MGYFQYGKYQVYYELHGTGDPIILLHGNTATSSMFAPIIPALQREYTVITMDFLGCGKSDRIPVWPCDLWFDWSEQVYGLCKHLELEHVVIIGISGGALAAINVALEHPRLVKAVVADSFAGVQADSLILSQIQNGRDAARQIEGVRSYLYSLHGEDWEQVLDADTDAILRHGNEIGAYFHCPIETLAVRMLLTGSEADEMFPSGHYGQLFCDICKRTERAESHIFCDGGHPAMLSNMNDFVEMMNWFIHAK